MVSGEAATGFDPAELQRPLPRGQHKLPREVVVANQLARLLWATALEIDERGYSAISVADITARARVSRLTFYELFDNKLDCVLAAQRAAIGRLRELIARAYEAEPSWGEGVAAALVAVLGFAAAAPEEANLLLDLDRRGGEPELAARGRAALGELEAAMRSSSQRAGLLRADAARAGGDRRHRGGDRGEAARRRNRVRARAARRTYPPDPRALPGRRGSKNDRSGRVGRPHDKGGNLEEVEHQPGALRRDGPGGRRRSPPPRSRPRSRPATWS